MAKIKSDLFDVRICPECKKEFIKPIESIYKYTDAGRVKYACSYTCWNKALRRLGRL